MKNYPKSVVVLAALWLVVSSSAAPVRRSPDLEARRRSAIDRSMIRFGRSYPPEPSAADLRDAFSPPSRRGNSFLRFGRSQPFTLTPEDLYTLLKNYDDVYEKRSASFLRFGRDPILVKLGRTNDEDKVGYSQNSEPVVGFGQRKRARDHFVRLGRDSEELDRSDFEEDDRTKRAADCHECQP